ncbi:YggS family pyridoxal phosphate-dependent enzyme [Flavobacterium oreochromis]|uniref:Pyridoxal phosphate homeostasis protein n=1 Tax=Flavobacterium oreochromis TaxID=2906078 RepID=A0ABW8P728_9FLAO|nr:YggS family pyridoxal phosphate-dependent enzyme [Flavobacterium oreochromis]OWP76109.1 YggS family pyridoxal phosphate enzyme [Flavobacterium oreochromis]POR23236.1 YggS family pyridoxal phosphate enzyme [Flavobacterium columnare]
MSIANNLNNIKSTLPPHVTLVAVSKTKPVSDLLEAYNAGQRIFGENYVQELVEKQPQLPADTEWHFIGHLQSRKVKLIAPFVSLIHGVDSLKLLQEINKQAEKNNRVINCLLQVFIAEEESKFGLDEKELEEILHFVQTRGKAEQSEANDNSLNNIKIVGFMGMATFTDDLNQIKKEFLKLKSIFDKYKELKTANCQLNTLSMGMSGDYQLAIECGSTMIRIGSSIFGTR